MEAGGGAGTETRRAEFQRSVAGVDGDVRVGHGAGDDRVQGGPALRQQAAAEVTLGLGEGHQVARPHLHDEPVRLGGPRRRVGDGQGLHGGDLPDGQGVDHAGDALPEVRHHRPGVDARHLAAGGGPGVDPGTLGGLGEARARRQLGPDGLGRRLRVGHDEVEAHLGHLGDVRPVVGEQARRGHVDVVDDLLEPLLVGELLPLGVDERGGQAVHERRARQPARRGDLCRRRGDLQLEVLARRGGIGRRERDVADGELVLLDRLLDHGVQRVGGELRGDGGVAHPRHRGQRRLIGARQDAQRATARRAGSTRWPARR